MVERAFDTKNNMEVDAYSAFQNDETDIRHYYCYDTLCRVPLTLVNRENKNFYFRTSQKSKPHIADCIALLAEKEDKESLQDNNNNEALEKLKKLDQPLYTVDIGPRTKSGENTKKSNITDHNQEMVIKHKRITDFATLVDLLHNRQLKRYFQIPINIRYDNASAAKKYDVSGTSGTRTVGDLVYFISRRLQFEPEVNRFYYFGGLAKVSEHFNEDKTFYRVEYVNKTPSGKKIVMFIEEPENHNHCEWWQYLHLLATQSQRYYGLIYAAGHLYIKENQGKEQYQLLPQVSNPLRNFYVPQWGFKKFKQ